MFNDFFWKNHLGFLPFSKAMNAYVEIKLFNDILGFYTFFSVFFQEPDVIFKLYPHQLKYYFKKHIKNCYENLNIFKNQKRTKHKFSFDLVCLLWFYFFFMFQIGEVQTRFSNMFSSGYILSITYMVFMYCIIFLL